MGKWKEGKGMAPKLLLNQGPSEPCYATVKPPKLYCLTGVRRGPIHVALRDSGEHLRLLLRTNLLRHQTSEQGGQRSHGSRSRRYHGNHVT